MSDERSNSALESDRRQEAIVFKERTKQLWLLIAILIIGVSLAVWQNISVTYIISGIAAWVVMSLHLSITAILHELYELNDQISGRKDEFKKVINQKPA